MPKLSVYEKTLLLIEEDSSNVLRAMLEADFWSRLVEPGKQYKRLGDDENSGELTLQFGQEGSGFISVISDADTEGFTMLHRFKTTFGGGVSMRTRNALIALAVAIRLDNESNPQSEHDLDGNI